MNRLRYSVDLSYEVLDAEADFLFNIEAARTARQTVVSERLTLPPVLRMDHYNDPLLCNRLIRLRAPKGHLAIHYEAVVDIDHRLDEPSTLSEVPVAQLPFEVLPYLAPSRYCESDRLMEFALREFGAIPWGYTRIVAIREWVRNHVRFLSTSTNERTSAVDTIVERTGVCRLCAPDDCDLPGPEHSRAHFQAALDYGADPALGPPDFHAFVEVFLSGRWYLADPSGTSIPTGLLRIGTGRDAGRFLSRRFSARWNPSGSFVQVHAVTDAALGLEMPLFTDWGICTW
ncbi:transglutaminase-like domain-containing protein [Cupriavidus basilensis]